MSAVEEFRQRLPDRVEAIGWCNAIKSWANVREQEVTSFDEAIDGRRLAKYVEEKTKNGCEEWGTLKDLQVLLSEGICEVDWLNRLYGFLNDNGFDEVTRECIFIADQDGYLDLLRNLHRDKDIDEELKDIADDLLDLGVRQKLRDNRLNSLIDEAGKGDLENKDVIREIVDKLKQVDCAEELSDKFAEASARLLSWIVNNQEWSHLSDYPAYSGADDQNHREVLRLTQSQGADPELPLAPVKAWPDGLQPFSELFPRRRILADIFYNTMPDPDAWRILDEKGFVRTNVIISNNRKIKDFLPDEPLPEIDGVHTTCDAVQVTDIVYLTGDDIGVMERVRHSRRLAYLFWRLLTEWLVVQDNNGLNFSNAICECGKTHRYFPAAWLVPLLERKWVPLGSQKTGRATSRWLGKLLRDSEWDPSSLENPETLKLLEAIRVTRFDLMREFIVTDDVSRAALDVTLTDILASTGGDLSHVRRFVEDIDKDEGLLDHLQKRREQRWMVHQNQELGRRIEDLVKGSLKGEGFIVKADGNRFRFRN